MKRGDFERGEFVIERFGMLGGSAVEIGTARSLFRIEEFALLVVQHIAEEVAHPDAHPRGRVRHAFFSE